MDTDGHRFKFEFLWMLLAVMSYQALAQPAKWWDDAWKYRLRVRTAARSGPAQCQFPIPQGGAGNGADVRVVDAAGNPCPMRLMYFQQGLYGIVAFQLNGSPHYWIYLGNPQAAAPAPWEPRAGVFLQTLRNSGVDPNQVRSLRDLAAGGGYSFGAGYREWIYEGIDPFGEPDKYVSIYEAYFNAPADGEYLFATISKDASFLLIDGRQVAAWPGAHDAAGGARAQHNGKIRLTRGVHQLQYLHADFGGERQCVVAAWMPPGTKVPRAMAVADFVPIAPAQAEALEERGAPLIPDFRGAQIARLIAPEYTCTAWQLVNCTAAQGAAVADCRWEFSDGTVYAGGTINKVFFTAGDFTLTLTVRDAQGRTVTATRAFRVHAIATQKPPEDEALLRYFADVAAKIPAGMLTGPGAADAAARVLRDAGRADEAARLWLERIERQWKESKTINEVATGQVVALYCGKLRRPEAAEELLRVQLARAGGGGPRARLLLELGRLQLNPLGQAPAALATLRAARLLLEKDADEALRRRVLIALGDACRATAAADEALEAYQSAEKLAPPTATQKYDRSSFALATESYLREGRLEEAAAEIDKWVELYPTDRITGYASILVARLLHARKDAAGAAAALEEFLKCKPLGVFARTALEELGDLYRELGRPADARASYQRVLDEFQDEAVQSRIKNKLGEIR